MVGCYVTTIFAIIYGIPALLFAMFVKGGAFLYPFAAVCAVVAFGCVVIFRRWGARPRAMLFHADGRVTVPHGVPFYPRCTKLNAPHVSFATIEMRRWADGEHGVSVYTRDGDTIAGARGLDEWQARKIVVQLTCALHALRDDTAASLRGRVHPAHATAPVKQFID